MIEYFYHPGFTVERYTESTNDMGDAVKRWEPHLETEGRLDYLSSAMEEVRAGAEHVVATHVWFTHAGQDIKEQDRLVYNGQAYNILFVDDVVTMGHHLEVLVEVVR